MAGDNAIGICRKNVVGLPLRVFQFYRESICGTYGLRGFVNFASMCWLIVLVSVALVVGGRRGVPGLQLESMLRVATGPVGVVMAFGVTYAVRDWRRHIRWYGRDRAAEAGLLVLMYLACAVGTLGRVHVSERVVYEREGDEC